MCHACGKKGHIRKVYRSKTGGKSGATWEPNPVHVDKEVASEDSQEYFLYQFGILPFFSPLQTTVSINGKDDNMEVDTGASLTVISETTLAEIWRPNQVPR